MKRGSVLTVKGFHVSEVVYGEGNWIVQEGRVSIDRGVIEEICRGRS